jgi:hypothetical protein
MTRNTEKTAAGIYFIAAVLAVGAFAGCGKQNHQVEAGAKAAAKAEDWKFPREGMPATQANGMWLYDLGEGYKGTYLPTQKRGHTVTIGVPSAVLEQARQNTSDEEAISRAIAWEAFRRAFHPLHEDPTRDYVGVKRKGAFFVHRFRTAGGATASAMVEIENNALVKGSAVRIWREPRHQG